MAIDFYELGRQTGAKTPKGRQSGLQSLVGSIDKTISGMLKTSQAKTTALTAAMPQGIPIDKVPEELRTKATEFLTKNKTAYTDATKVIASGINAQSQRYKDAVEIINRVNTRFENLSTSLEAVALKRKASLDDPMGYSPGTNPEDRLTWSNLGNGDLYAGMTFNEDGTVSYTDSKGVSKPFADFNVSPQSFEGQNTFLALNDKYTGAKYSGKTKDWSLHSGEAELRINQLFQKLKPAGQKDMMMADVLYLEKLTGFEADTDEYEAEYSKLLENPADAIAGYKSHILETLEKNYNDQSAKPIPGSGSGTDTGGEWTYSSGKSLFVLGGNRTIPPDFANAMKISLQEAADGKETSFDFFDTKLNYDPKANNGEGDWSFNNGDEKVSYGDTKNLINNWLKIKDPGFLRIAVEASSGAPAELKTPTITNTPFLPDGKVYKGGATSKDLIATTGDDGDQVVRNLNQRIINPSGKEYRFVVAKATDFVKTDVFGETFLPEFQKGLAKWVVNKWESVYRFRIFDGDNNPVGNYSFKIDDNIPNSENPMNTVNDSKESAKEFNRVMKELGIKLQDDADL